MIYNGVAYEIYYDGLSDIWFSDNPSIDYYEMIVFNCPALAIVNTGGVGGGGTMCEVVSDGSGMYASLLDYRIKLY